MHDHVPGTALLVDPDEGVFPDAATGWICGEAEYSPPRPCRRGRRLQCGAAMAEELAAVGTRLRWTVADGPPRAVVPQRRGVAAVRKPPHRSPRAGG